LTALVATALAAAVFGLPKPSFLACPPGYCQASEAIPSPVLPLPWERLREYWKEVISGEKRVETVAADPENRRFVYIQRSPTFRFPDIITVEFVQLGSDRSSIAIFSRSRYGRYDFAKNRKRVVRWLAVLEKMAQPAIPQRRRAE
jgi:hypothetical protein